MRVLFDHQVFSWQSYGGISRYFFELAKGLRARGNEVLFPERFYNENIYLRSLPGIQAGPIAPFDFKGKKWLQERLGRRQSLHALHKSNFDIFHPTYFNDYFLAAATKQKQPFVITIHDMIHEIYGHGSSSFFSLDAQVVPSKRLLAQQAQAIVTVSENTRRDVLRLIPDVDPNKVFTVHHGNSIQPMSPGSPNNLLLPERFLLFVGQRAAYKNFSWMIEQLAPLLREDDTLYIVCAGGASFFPSENLKMTQLGISSKVLHPQVRSDADLSELYSRAQCFIFPSKYEGFGIPVLEAFACACPAVLNASSSLPEVGGDAALYFNDTQGETLVSAVKKILEDAALRRSLVQLGLQRVQQFTWEKTVEAHLTVYRKAIEAS